MRGRLAMCRAHAHKKGGGIAVAVFLHPSEVLNKLCSKNTTSAGLNEVGRGEVFSEGSLLYMVGPGPGHEVSRRAIWT